MSEQAQPAVRGRRLRADARRNRDRLLVAARDAFIDRGSTASLEQIARAAGVGIGTLYRHFPDRAALIRAVVVDVRGRTAEAAAEALAEEPDAFAALARYLHRALEVRAGAVMPLLVGVAPMHDDEIERLGEAVIASVRTMISRARAAGTLRADVTEADVGMLLVRLSRPLLGGRSRDLDDRLAHRHLDLVIDGLRAGGDQRPLRGPGPTLTELNALPAGQPPAVGAPGALDRDVCAQRTKGAYRPCA
jgi:AcrR family transcriptional regulator